MHHLADPELVSPPSPSQTVFDYDFTLTSGIMVLLMQTALAFREAGSVRYKNT